MILFVHVITLWATDTSADRKATNQFISATKKTKRYNERKKMPFQNHHDPVLFTNFLAQAVVSAKGMLARQTDIMLHVFVNI